MNYSTQRELGRISLDTAAASTLGWSEAEAFQDVAVGGIVRHLFEVPVTPVVPYVDMGGLKHEVRSLHLSEDAPFGVVLDFPNSQSRLSA